MLQSLKQLLLGTVAVISGLLSLGGHHQLQPATTPPPQIVIMASPSPSPINCDQVNSQIQNTGRKYTVDEYLTCGNTPTPAPSTKYQHRNVPQDNSIYYPTNTTEPIYIQPTPTPTPAGLQGQVNCNSNYAGGYNCSDYHGNQTTLNPNYAGGYQGQDNHGNQINLNPNYAGGYQGTMGNKSFNCQPNYANGYNCN